MTVRNGAHRSATSPDQGERITKLPRHHHPAFHCPRTGWEYRPRCYTSVVGSLSLVPRASPLPRRPRTSARLELADFLKTRRERLHPADVGLPTTARRRTPGLRREEIAHIAGVGVTWYTWLEQARDIGVSAHFLEQIARALRLDGEERAHLFVLAHNRPPPVDSRSSFGLTPSHQKRSSIRSKRRPTIATAYLDVLAWNDALNAVFGDLSDVAAVDRNMLWLMFAAPRSEPPYPIGLKRHGQCWHVFGSSMDATRTTTEFTTLIDRLCGASREFRCWWPEHHVTVKPEGPKRFTSPLVGEMELEQSTLSP